MKRIIILLALLAVTAAVTVPAQAGLFKRGKTKKEPVRKEQSWRYDRLPTMAFTKGELKQDGFGAWKVGEVRLQFAPNCEFTGADGPRSLGTGQTVVVMGPRVGGTMVAWQVDVQKPAHIQPTRSDDVNIRWSDADPTVGVGHGPN